MGFSENGSRRAALATQNISADVAMGWVFEHMEDANFNDPLPVSSPADEPSVVSKMQFDPDSIATLTSFGFTEAQAKKSLKETNSDIERYAAS